MFHDIVSKMIGHQILTETNSINKDKEMWFV